MKKLSFFILLLAILGLNMSFATVNASSIKTVQHQTISKEKSNIFVKISNKIEQTKVQITNIVDNLKKQYGGSLKTALLLMVVGLIFLILAGIIGGGIVWAVGAIFFLLGALLLLLYLL